MISLGRHLSACRWRSSGAAAIGLALLQAFAFGSPSASAQRLPTNPSQGKVIIGRAACGSCHEIPYVPNAHGMAGPPLAHFARSEEHTSELQSHVNLVCRLLLEKKKKKADAFAPWRQ